MSSAFVNLLGVNVHYHVEGRGPDIVMIHGWASSRRMWRTFIDQLAPEFRCWSLDLPGFGDSDKPAGAWYSIPNYTATVRYFLDVMGLPAAHVIGHSMGGLISLDVAAMYPERVTRLIVINPVVTGRPNLRPFADWERGAEVLGRTQQLSRRLLAPMAGHPLLEALPAGLHNYWRRAEDFSKAPAETLLGAGRAIVAYDVSPKLARITAPTLVMLGTLDVNVSNAEGHRAAVEIPGAKLAVFTAGHLVTDDYPQATGRVIREFLA